MRDRRLRIRAPRQSRIPPITSIPTTACQACSQKAKCSTGKERRIKRWEHEAVLKKVQARLDGDPGKMRIRRQTVEHPFGTFKSWMGSTHFQMKTLKHVGTDLALHVLAYNIKRVMQILGNGGLIEAIAPETHSAGSRKPASLTSRSQYSPSQADSDGTTAPSDEIPAEPAIHTFNC